MHPPSPQTLSTRIREEAFRLGFFKVGIARAEPLPAFGNLDTWLEKGFHGEMHYLARHAAKRRDPRLFFPEARSLLVLAMNYYTGDYDGRDPMKGRISRYAHGEDYHLLVKGRLEQLLGCVQSLQPRAEGICYADTGPVMEKAWGARSTLGWIGKNTSLITRSHGSWFFIGVILLDTELEYDSGEKNYCGTCRRCIDACPTGAIVAPYLLDARRCISYLTIELRGPIPRPLRPLIGNRIFGCDQCQESCPWNRFAMATAEAGFRPAERNNLPDLMSLLHLSAEEFRLRFKNTSIWRATREGLVRNVAVALGNSGREEAVPALGMALQDSSPLVRSHAAWALGRFSAAPAVRILESARSREENPMVLEDLNIALAIS